MRHRLHGAWLGAPLEPRQLLLQDVDLHALPVERRVGVVHVPPQARVLLLQEGGAQRDLILLESARLTRPGEPG